MKRQEALKKASFCSNVKQNLKDCPAGQCKIGYNV